MSDRRGKGGGRGRHDVFGKLLEASAGEGPSAKALQDGIVERVRRIESRSVLLALDAVLSVQEPPFDAELSVEAMLGVAEMVAGMRLLQDARQQDGEEEGDEPS